MNFRPCRLAYNLRNKHAISKWRRHTSIGVPHSSDQAMAGRRRWLLLQSAFLRQWRRRPGRLLRVAVIEIGPQIGYVFPIGTASGYLNLRAVRRLLDPRAIMFGSPSRSRRQGHANPKQTNVCQNRVEPACGDERPSGIHCVIDRRNVEANSDYIAGPVLWSVIGQFLYVHRNLKTGEQFDVTSDVGDCGRLPGTIRPDFSWKLLPFLGELLPAFCSSAIQACADAPVRPVDASARHMGVTSNLGSSSATATTACELGERAASKSSDVILVMFDLQLQFVRWTDPR